MGRPAFLDQLFPPMLVMRHQLEISLTAEQRKAITTTLAETQKKLVDLRWQFGAESQKLTKLLASAKVDPATALALAEQVMSIELRIKKAHVALLIGVKNELTAEQQVKLRELRHKSRLRLLGDRAARKQPK